MAHGPPDSTRRLFPLTSCSIGVWTPSEGTRAYLLLCPDRKQFVVLLTRDAEGRARRGSGSSLSVNALLACVRNQAALWLRHKNPFVDHTQQPGSDTAVLTFEAAFSDVVGLDFRWPLTDEPRLVLEAATLHKRVFNSVDEVCSHYPPIRSQRRLRVSGPSPVPEEQDSPQHAAAAGHAVQPALQQHHQQHTQQHQPGAAAADAGDGGGGGSSGHTLSGLSMSRVSSWASWASWNIGSARNSLDVTTAAAAPAPAAAASAASAFGCAAAAGGSDADTCQAHTASGRGCAQQQQQHAQAMQPCELPCGSSHRLAAAAADVSCGSTRTLESMVSLQAGLGGSLAAADAALAPCACNADSTSCSSLQAAGDPALGALKLPVKSGQAGALRMAAASHAPSTADSTPRGAAASSTAVSECGDAPHPLLAGVLDGAQSEPGGSFGFWPSQRQQQAGWLLVLDAPLVISGGAATAPCTMPCSPRFGSSCSSPTAAAPEQLMVHLSLLKQQQAAGEHRQQQTARLAGGSGGGGGGRRSGGSSRSRLASAAAEASCPLCHQGLVQPLAVLQQRFHQQQDHKHLRLAARLGARGSGNSRAAVPRSRSACSLLQLQQQCQEQEQQQQRLQQQQQRAATVGGSASPQMLQPQRPATEGGSKLLHVQQQQQDKQQGGARQMLGGLATAAMSSLTARGKAAARSSVVAGSSSIKQCDLVACKASSGSISNGQSVEAVAAAIADAAVQQALAASCHDSSTHVSAGSATAQAAAVDGGAKLKPPAAAHVTFAAAGGSGRADDGSSPEAAPRSLLSSSSPDSDAPAAAAAAPANGKQPQQQDTGDSHTSYSNRTVVLTFKDPTLPYQLTKLVKNDSNVHLLKLYESGLPAWAIVLPSYGLWYRPWLRRVTWMLFVLLSVVSMAMGFYDLWKNVPYFKQFVVHMFRPAAAVFEWLEGHTQIRLSILLTYMLGKSQLLVELVKLLTHASLAPLLAPLYPLATALSAMAGGVRWMLQPFVTAIRLLLGPIGRLLWLAVQLVWQLVSTLLWFGPLQVVSLLGSGLLGVMELLLLPLQAVLPASASIRAGWSAARATGRVAQTAAPAVASAARSAGWWSPLEALELMRVSTVRVAKALQAVLRFFVALASAINKHRLSLLMQLRGKLWGSLQAAAHSPAGRVASAVALKMGQGERLQRVQRHVARRLHRHESLASMGSEALTGPLTPGAPLGYGGGGRHGRSYSLDGDSELLQERTAGAGGAADSDDDDGGGEVTSRARWGSGGGGGIVQVLASPVKAGGWGGEGLRLRAAAAAAAATAAGGLSGAAAAAAAAEASWLLQPEAVLAGSHAFGQRSSSFQGCRQHDVGPQRPRNVAGCSFEQLGVWQASASDAFATSSSSGNSRVGHTSAAGLLMLPERPRPDASHLSLGL